MGHRAAVIAFVCVFSLCAASTAAQERSAPPGSRPVPPAESRPTTLTDAVVARVNRTVITRSEVEKEIPRFQQLSARDREPAFQQALFQLVKRSIESEAVARVGINLPKRVIEEEFERARAARQGQDGGFEKFIADYGYQNADEFKSVLAEDLTRRTYIQAETGVFGDRAPQFRPETWVEPSAQEIRQYYRAHEADEFTEEARGRVSAIWLPFRDYPAPTGGKPDDGARAVAAEIAQKFATGSEFSVLAQNYSKGLKEKAGGDLGWVDAKSEYQPEIKNAALTAPVHVLTDPIPQPANNPRALVLLLVDNRIERRVIPLGEAQSKIVGKLRAEAIRGAELKMYRGLIEESYIWPESIKKSFLR